MTPVCKLAHFGFENDGSEENVFVPMGMIAYSVWGSEETELEEEGLKTSNPDALETKSDR